MPRFFPKRGPAFPEAKSVRGCRQCRIPATTVTQEEPQRLGRCSSFRATAEVSLRKFTTVQEIRKALANSGVCFARSTGEGARHSPIHGLDYHKVATQTWPFKP